MECYYCKSAIPDEAIKCRYCGGWITRDGSVVYTRQEQTSHVPPPIPPPIPSFELRQPEPWQSAPFQNKSNHQYQQVNVSVPKSESPLFAVITMILYLFTPLGGISGIIAFLLNIIGLITGPKRGCFVQLLVFFVIIPGVIIIFLLILAKDLLEDLLDNFSDILPF